MNYVDEFIRKIPDMTPGSYTVSLYDPQEGEFLETKTNAEVKADGILRLSVSSFLIDLSYLLLKKE